MFPYIVVSFLILICAVLGRHYRLWRLVAFVLIALFVGLRFKVGTDFESYSDYFYTPYFFLEPGFNFLVTYFSQFKHGETYMFLSMSFMTYLFLFLYIEFNEDARKAGYFPIVLLFTLMTITISCNGIRQTLAVAIFMFSTIFIKKRNLPIFLALILFGFLFHKSILIVLPLYFIKDFHLKPWLYIVIYMVSFMFMQYDLKSMVGPFEFLFEDYDRYTNLVDTEYGTSYLGLGNMMQIVSYIIFMWLSFRNKMHEKYPFYFNMFFIACVLMNMRVGASLLVRLMMYFSWFCYILYPLTLKEEKNKILRQLCTIYYVAWCVISSIHYIAFDSNSKMLPYHDVLGIF